MTAPEAPEAPEARELLAACKRQRDVWRIAGMAPSPEAVARVEREEAEARAVIAADDDEVDMAAPIGPMLADEAAAWLREVEAARGDCDPSATVRAGYRVEAALRGVVTSHAARVAAEAEADGLRRDLVAVWAERDLYRAALADAARGELPGCYECPRPATCCAEENGHEYLACDYHRGEYEWTDTPHAAAIRRALKATEGER